MTNTFVQYLNQLNQQFYLQTEVNFSQTRQYAWDGWKRLLPYIGDFESKKTPFRILDVGCGNGRFGKFIRNHFSSSIEYVGIDSNAHLLAEAQKNMPSNTLTQTSFFQIDFLVQLIESKEILAEKTDTLFDLVVVFGVLHHIPSRALRHHFLLTLAQQLSPKGTLVFSTWQFDQLANLWSRRKDPKKLGIDQRQLETGDFFLDWGLNQNSIRYCHLSSDEEIQKMMKHTHLEQIEVFSSQGRDKANTYYIYRQSIPQD